MMTWTVVAPAISAAFLSSLVEAVEALTIELPSALFAAGVLPGLGALVGLVTVCAHRTGSGHCLIMFRCALCSLQLASCFCCSAVLSAKMCRKTQFRLRRVMERRGSLVESRRANPLAACPLYLRY
jgi:uncharacterized membrane protein